jgi:hypothetical protein
MEFHISRAIRDRLKVDDLLFSYTGNVVFANVAASRKLAQQINDARGPGADPSRVANAGALFAMGLIDELNHAMVARYRKDIDPAVLAEAIRWFEAQIGPKGVKHLLLSFTEQFPSVGVYRGRLTAAEWLNGATEGLPNREAALEELMFLWLANQNPGFAPFRELFEDTGLQGQEAYQRVTGALPEYFETRPPVAPGLGSLLDVLRAPFLESPDSLTGQLDRIRELWGPYLGPELKRVLLAIDVLREEDLAIWMRFNPPSPDKYEHGAPGFGGEGFVGDEYVGFDDQYVIGPDGVRHLRYASDYQAPLNEYEAFSADQAWMPNVVLIAKSTYVWLEQLSKKYGRHIHRLDQIPDEELQLLVDRGITSLWLIGLWERSTASMTIKRLRGHADAVASAYSLMDYRIADDLGGDEGYRHLRDRAAAFGMRLASDMVPNHMGIDSYWVVEHPDWFLYRWESPFPVYSFNGPDLSTDSRVEIKIEDHYYEQTDAAVVFRLKHYRENTTRYVYHGNDGTTFAWNDTAQLDYSKADVREHVMQVILHVARLFPIIRFDAAMVLAKRHVQRLWFPLPGAGGSIPSRAENAMSQEEFDALMPHEFWREVVDRVAVEVPGTLLLAEAFWLLEGYFVRTLGMHRVYNSAFMNMLRDEENAKYRSYLKKTIEFDPDILKRYVSFMSNPDERTAIDQFGSGDKYFGVCTLLATLPGLPMFGHGQIEGYTERYGMEFKQAKMDERPNEALVARHQHEIAPLLKNRRLFAESTDFVLYDFWTDRGSVDENVFAYSNRRGGQRALILYNNSYGSTHGTIHISAASMDKGSGELRQRTLGDGLGLPNDLEMFLAYRDTAHGLEYLRRSTDLQQNGLRVDLRGYQYVVLLDWRELRATQEQPWDRLYDALAGGGVHSVEEALSKLRLRPLHEALRRAISEENIHVFFVVTPGKKKLPVVDDELVVGVDVNGDVKTAAASAVEAKSDAVEMRLEPFVQASRVFFERVTENIDIDEAAIVAEPNISEAKDTAGTEGAAGLKTVADGASAVAVKPEPAYEEKCEELALGAAGLASLEKTWTVAWPKAARRMLPHSTSEIFADQLWAPVLAWVVLRSIPWRGDRGAMFDNLHLRSALSEIFSSIGLEGENTWRAAARVRILLARGGVAASETLHTRVFWNDPDVRWLLSVNESEGITYFNKESFEEMVGWLQVPALVELARASGWPKSIAEVEAEVVTACDAATAAGFRLDRFLAKPVDDSAEPASETEAASTVLAEEEGASAVDDSALVEQPVTDDVKV